MFGVADNYVRHSTDPLLQTEIECVRNRNHLHRIGFLL